MSRCALLLSPLLLIGCTLSGGGGGKGGGGGGGRGGDNGSVETSYDTVTSGSRGRAQVEVDVGSDTRSFLVTATSASGLLALEGIEDPDGNKIFDWADWYDGNNSITYAIFPENPEVVVNWPIRDEDEGLSSGTYTLTLSTLDRDYYYKSDVELDVWTQTRSSEPRTIKVLLVYAEGLDEDETVVSGTEAAVERWREVWALYDIELELSYTSSNIDPELADPGSGDESYLEASEAGDDVDITVIVGDTIGRGLDTLGQAANIPGPLVATSRSVTAAAWLANAGADGRFSGEDIRLYGETLAHEVGHYVGLFHPVESSYDYYDALGDTPECGSWRTCDDEMGDNLMYPYPVCDRSGCVPQDVLSGEQVGVMQNYTGTW
jgi:hypothetical protein